MSQSGEAESVLHRFLEVEGSLHRPKTCHENSPPPLVKVTSSATPVDEAVTLNGHPTRRSSSASRSPAHAAAVAEEESSTWYRDLGGASTSSSSASSDTQEEAATPPRRSSSNQHAITPTAVADTFAQAPALRSSIPSASPSPPLSLSHPVVQFLTGVQLQGYSARLMCDLGIRSISDLAEWCSTLKDASVLLGPSASLQQQNELLRGFRRWERGEARRAKAEATEARQRALRENRVAKGVAKRLCAKKSRSRTVKTKESRATTTCTAHSGGPEDGRGSDTGSGQQSMQISATLSSCVDTHGSAFFRLSDVCDHVLQPHSTTTDLCLAEADPHAIAGGSGDVVASSLKVPPPHAGFSVASSSCPSLTTCAIELMGQLSHRCTYSREAAARRRRAGRHRCCRAGRGSQGECADATLRTATKVAPYDVDAEDVDAVTTSDLTSHSRGSHRGGSEECAVLCDVETRMPQAEVSTDGDAGDALPGEESLPSGAQRANVASAARLARYEMEEVSPNAEELVPPPALSTACDSCESGLSTVLCSLREAVEQQPVVQELSGPDGVDGNDSASAHWPLAALSAPPDAFGDVFTENDSATAESHRPVCNDLVTTSHISLAALSTCTEVQVLPPLEPTVAPGNASVLPVSEATGKTASPDAHPIAARYPAMDSGATCNASQQQQQHRDSFALVPESSAQPRQSGQIKSSLATTGTSLPTNDTAKRSTFLEGQLEDARHRLDDALREALRSYNAEVKTIRYSTALPLTDDTVANKCVPLRAVLQPIPFSARAAGAYAPGAAAELGTPTELVLWMLSEEGGIKGAETHSCSSPSPTAAVSGGAEPEERAAFSAAAALHRVSADREVLSIMTSTDTSTRTTVRSTAAPVVALCCCSTLSSAATLEGEGCAGTAALSALTPRGAVECRLIRDDEDEEGDGVSCESVGRLTTGTQHLSTHVEMSNASKAPRGPTLASDDKVAAEGRSDNMGDYLWVAQDSPLIAQQSPFADPAAANVNTIENVPSSDEWWAEYGIEALEYTQNSPDSGAGGWAASPGVNAAHPRTTSNGGGGLPTREVDTPSPAPVEVIELHSGTDSVDADSRGSDDERDARTRSPEASSDLRSRAAPSLPLPPLSPPRDRFGEGLTVSSTTASAAPMRSSLQPFLDSRLHPDAWPRMTNAELRQLCGEFGLLVLPPTSGDATAREQASIPQRRAVLLERESLLEALRLLATRLRFRHTVAPFFLHRVTRLSGLPYKRMRVANFVDEGTVLTRDDLRQARLRYKAEEQEEVDRCIVSALVAEAAEAVEQYAQSVASRSTTLPMFAAEGSNRTHMKVTATLSALASLPSGEVRCCYDQILLREPVSIDASAAVVQSSFPHISHTRVQQLLAANEVIADAVVTASYRSPSPLPSSPLTEVATPVQLEAGQAIAVPQPSGELTGDTSPSINQTDGGGAVQATATTTPLSQEERKRANARRYFAQRGYITRRQRGD
nr:unnamed protein product [Leishmania braziliensis]